MKEYMRHIPESEVAVLAGDHVAWSRLYAKTLQERTYEHQPLVLSGAKPVTVKRKGQKQNQTKPENLV
jgi:hypothetical protein